MRTKQKVCVVAVLSAFFLQGLGVIVPIPILEALVLVMALWVYLSCSEEKLRGQSRGVGKEILSLLKSSAILHFLGVIFLVAVMDVGTSAVSSMLVIDRFGWEVEEAVRASQVYFACRTIGLLLGTFLMLKATPLSYFRYGIILCVVAMLLLVFCRFEPGLVFVLIGVVGILCSSMFPLVYSMAVHGKQEKMPLISGWVMIAMACGGMVASLIGWATNHGGNHY